jgi:hypothetical protein
MSTRERPAKSLVSPAELGTGRKAAGKTLRVVIETDRAPTRWTGSSRCLSYLPFSKGLEDRRRLPAQGRVATTPVGEGLDVVEELLFGADDGTRVEVASKSGRLKVSARCRRHARSVFACVSN